MSISQYWHPNQLGKKKIRYKNTEDYYTHIAEVFNTAVKRRLRSNYPIASHLSGGLDSSSVSALAAIELAKQDRTLDAYISYSNPEQSVNSNYDSVDDRPLAWDLANMYLNIKLTEVPINDKLTFENISKLLPELGFFTRNVHNIGWIHDTYNLAKKNNARTFLTGASGNLTISWGYRYSTLWQQIKSTLRKTAIEIQKTIQPRYKWANCTIFRESAIKKFKINTPPFYYKKKYSLRYCINLNSTHYSGWKSITSQLSYSKNGMAIYDPTEDIDLLDTLLSCPKHIFNFHKEKRNIIKYIMKKKLPESIIKNKKTGIQNAEFMRQIFQNKHSMLEYFNTLNSATINTEKAIEICQKLNSFLVNKPIADRNLYLDIKGDLSLAYALRNLLS